MRDSSSLRLKIELNHYSNLAIWCQPYYNLSTSKRRSQMGKIHDYTVYPKEPFREKLIYLGKLMRAIPRRIRYRYRLRFPNGINWKRRESLKPLPQPIEEAK